MTVNIFRLCDEDVWKCPDKGPDSSHLHFVDDGFCVTLMFLEIPWMYYNTQHTVVKNQVDLFQTRRYQFSHRNLQD